MKMRDDLACHRWAIVLAGGSGTRLASLAAQANGAAVPKQYCSLHGGKTLLGETLARAEQLVPADRVVTVVASQHEAHWRRALRGRTPGTTIVQPQGRGTAPGILLPLLSILDRDPSAEVMLLPSDHFVADEATLIGALHEAQRAASCSPDRVLLVGVEPEGPEPDYGWILPGTGSGGTHAVRRFVEKPDRRVAADLMQAGAVWNTFLLAGTGLALLRLYAARQPGLIAAFVAADAAGDPDRLTGLYATIPDVDFCRDVLARSEPQLGLRIAPACGWTDLGTPERVALCAAWFRQHQRALPSPGSLCAAAAPA